MGRPGEVAFLLALFVLLGTLHGTRAQYDDYDDYNYEEDDYDSDDGEEYEDEERGYPPWPRPPSGYPRPPPGYRPYPEYAPPPPPPPPGYPSYPGFAELEESSGDSDDGYEGGSSPQMPAGNKEFTPECNNENCWIRVDWEPPPRDTWMSCLLGYRVGFRKYEEYEQQDWTWMNDEGTYRDLRSDKLFFFEEAERTNHSLTIRNLDFETDYEVKVEVFNPYGTYYPTTRSIERTPPG